MFSFLGQNVAFILQARLIYFFPRRETFQNHKNKRRNYYNMENRDTADTVVENVS